MRNGWLSASCIMSPPPLEWPTTGTGPLLVLAMTAIASRTSASQE